MVKTIVFEHLNCLSDLKTASAIIFELRVKRLVYFYTSIQIKISESFTRSSKMIAEAVSRSPRQFKCSKTIVSTVWRSPSWFRSSKTIVEAVLRALIRVKRSEFFYASLSVKIHESYTSVKKSEDSCKNTRVLVYFYTSIFLSVYQCKTRSEELTYSVAAQIQPFFGYRYLRPFKIRTEAPIKS